MTKLQRILNRLGAWRFRRFRRWVGGRWAERYIEPTPHSSESPCYQWVLSPDAGFDDFTSAIEQWSVAELPPAHARETSPRGARERRDP